MPEIDREIAKIIDEQRNSLSQAIVSLQYQLQPEIWEPYGEKGRELSLRDSNHHFNYLVEALKQSDPTLFADYVVWLKQLFEGIKIPPEALPKMLDCTGEVLFERLPPEMTQVIYEYISTAKKRIQAELIAQPSFMTPDAPLHDLARQYLDLLLNGERHLASNLILQAVDRGESVKNIYLYVFQSSQYEIGRLWHSNKVSVAQEHYCSAATQLIMSQLYSHIFSTEKVGRKLVAACVGGELHEIGVRMVADFFEMEGWDTYYMGANTPTSSILEAIERHEADMVGISASMPFHRGPVQELIANIRDYDPDGKVKILVGGNALRTSPNLWRQLGADGFADDAQQAIYLANQLLAQKSLS
ncbi:MAG: cobalamin-dependent protein [Deltaproteobacteria bacterium]|nr:cobalamin-dependent protein [Deltaproteobacteria bacterium]